MGPGGEPPGDSGKRYRPHACHLPIHHDIQPAVRWRTTKRRQTLVKRVLTGRFMHETNTFSIVKTDMALWRRRDFHTENEIPLVFRGTRSALGATFEAADKYGWTLIHPVSANANPSGTVTDDAFETIGGMILGAAERQAPIEGVLFHLHGAMVTES